MCRLVVLLVGIFTLVNGHPPPDHHTGCDEAVLRLEKMLTDLTRRVHDLENQRQADVMEIANVRQDMEKVKTKNRQLKSELDHMVTTMCDRQPPNPDRRIDTRQHKSGSNTSQSPASTMNAEPSINDTNKDSQPSTYKTNKGEEKTVHIHNTSSSNQSGRIRRDELQRPKSLSRNLTNRVVSSDTVAFFSTLNHELTDVAKEQIIQFENVVTNNGGHYNQQSGVFTCGVEGTYVFTWTVYSLYAHAIYSELVKNGVAFAHARAGDGDYNAMSSTTAVVNLSPGDIVWTRVKDRSQGTKILPNLTMFGGFKI